MTFYCALEGFNPDVGDVPRCLSQCATCIEEAQLPSTIPTSCPFCFPGDAEAIARCTDHPCVKDGKEGGRL